MQKNSYPMWVSHTSMRDFINCPRAYFLRNIYKDPKSGKKINTVSPALALGNTVHDVLESLSELKVEERFKKSLLEQYEEEWKKFTGELGGFQDTVEESVYKKRGETMLTRVTNNPGPIGRKAVKLRSPDQLPPRFLLSEEENILLCGKIDWLEYFPEDDSVHIIDFKTGKHEEDGESLQLPIYALLVKNCQKRPIRQISYWYLENSNDPFEMPLPDIEKAREKILTIALQIKKARAERVFVCKREGGCFSCKPLEKIIRGEAKYVRTSGYQDIYVVSG